VTGCTDATAGATEAVPELTQPTALIEVNGLVLLSGTPRGRGGRACLEQSGADMQLQH
jgi:hypothetical protein